MLAKLGIFNNGIFIVCIGHLEKYLRDVFKTVEFKSELEKIELVCQLEFAGSTQFKDIFILVFITMLIGLNYEFPPFYRGKSVNTLTSRPMVPCLSGCLALRVWSLTHSPTTPALTWWQCWLTSRSLSCFRFNFHPHFMVRPGLPALAQ